MMVKVELIVEIEAMAPMEVIAQTVLMDVMMKVEMIWKNIKNGGDDNDRGDGTHWENEIMLSTSLIKKETKEVKTNASK